MKNTRILNCAVFLLVALLLMPAIAKAESIKLRVVVQEAEVRLKPEVSSLVVSTMSMDSVLDAEEGTAEWYKVTLPPDENGIVVSGYIKKSDTELVTAAPAEKKILVQNTQPLFTSPTPQMPQVAPRPRTSGGMMIGMRMYGGVGMLFGTNHINDYYGGYTDYYFDEWVDAYYWGMATTSGELELLKMGFLGGMEFFFNINPYIGFGFGFGYLAGSKESGPLEIDALMWWDEEEYSSFTQKISAIPITMTVYGGLPLGNMMRLVPYLGFGYYLGTVNYEEIYHWEDTYWTDYYDWNATWTGKANTLGFHAGINFDINFTKNVGMFLGLGGVVASLKDIVGDLEWEYEDYWWPLLWTDSGTDRDQQLWTGEEQWYTSRFYPWLYLSDTEPSETWYRRDVESAVVSLSHFRIVVGFVIYFKR